MIGRELITSVFLLGIAISCQQEYQTGDTYRETLFESMPSSHTGIKFKNQLLDFIGVILQISPPYPDG